MDLTAAIDWLADRRPARIAAMTACAQPKLVADQGGGGHHRLK